MGESLGMSYHTEDYKDIFFNLWSTHNNQIKIMRLWTIDEFYLDPKWGNLWI